MKRHWLISKNKKKKASFKDKETVESFCFMHGLDFHYERAPRSHWCIDDPSETKDDDIAEFAKNQFGIDEYRVTIRSNETAARNAIKGFLYHESVKPMYMMKTGEERLEILRQINEKYGTSFTFEDFGC